MRNLAIAAMVILTAIMVATFASADSVGIGIKKTAPLSGTGSSGSPLRITVCSIGQVYQVNAGGTAWECTTPATASGDITGVTVTSPACGAGSYMTTLTGGATSGDAPVGGSCTSEVGDVSSVVAGTGLVTGGTSGAVTVDVACGTGIACNANDVTLNMTAQSCSAGQHISAATALGVFTCSADSGGTYTAGDGITLTASDFDLDYTSDFQITGGQLDLSTAVTAPGTFAVAGNSTIGDAITDTLTINGATTIAGPSGAAAFTVNTNQTGQTTGLSSATVNSTGSFNTTAGNIDNFAFKAVATATESAGSNFLINYAIYANATSGDAAYSFYSPAGLFQNTGNGEFTNDLQVLGNTTLGNAAGDVVDINGDILKVGNAVDGQFFSKNESIGFQWGTASSATGYINYYGNGGTTSDFRSLIIANGKGVSIATFDGPTGHIDYHGAAPTLGSCTGCTMASYSTDARGRITCTDGALANSCTITFAVAYTTNPPACSIQFEKSTAADATNPVSTVTSASTSAITFNQMVTSGAHGYVYRCDGML